MASLDGSVVISDEISELCTNMLDAEYRITVVEEEIFEKIETGIEEWNVYQSYANNLVMRIAEAVGISTEESDLKTEVEVRKNEIDNDELSEVEVRKKYRWN